MPIRTCIGCREKREPHQLLRFRRRPDGELGLASAWTSAGRSAYLCPSLKCFRAAARGANWDRAFRAKTRVNRDPDVFWEEIVVTLVEGARFLYRTHRTPSSSSALRERLELADDKSPARGLPGGARGRAF